MNSSFSKKGPEVQAAGLALRRRKLPEPSASLDITQVLYLHYLKIFGRNNYRRFKCSKV